MAEFLLSTGNTPFAIALAIMLLMTLIELISTLLGMGLSDMVDSLLPEIHADADLDVDIDADIDVDGDVHVGGTSGVSDSLVKLLSWFRIGEVPVILLFILFLTGFGLSGLIVQYTTVKLIGTTLPSIIASIPAFFCAVTSVRFLGGILGKHMPKDETYVVSEKSFIGQLATVTTGTARKGSPAQAKLRDEHGQTHYILVVPDNDDEEFEQGIRCIVVSQKGSLFSVIASSSEALND